MRTYVHTQHTHAYIRTLVYDMIYTNIRTDVQTYRRTYIHTCVHTYIRTYVHKYAGCILFTSFHYLSFWYISVRDTSVQKSDYLSTWRKEYREAALKGDIYGWVWFHKTFLHGGADELGYSMYFVVTHLIKCHNCT